MYIFLLGINKEKYVFMFYFKVKVYAVFMVVMYRLLFIILLLIVVFWDVGWEFWESCDFGVI